MAETGAEKARQRPNYPGTLDVVEVGGKEFQVVGVNQTGNIKTDMYLLRDPRNSEVLITIEGAKFKAFDRTKEPESKNIYRQDEGVKVTGILVGGKKEVTKVSKP